MNSICLIVNWVCHISCLLRSWEGNTRRMDGNSVRSINMVTGFYAEIKPRILVSLWGPWRELRRCPAVYMCMKSLIIFMRIFVVIFYHLLTYLYALDCQKCCIILIRACFSLMIFVLIVYKLYANYSTDSHFSSKQSLRTETFFSPAFMWPGKF
jgi:hypothetical protein